MSGGVDSSVSAALLKDAGYDVTGVFIKVWQPNFVECTWREDRLDAMRVAAKLGIPFVTFDAEKEYKKHVVDYMIAEYKAGRTPNPDVMCNKYVKFGVFFDFAMKSGADFVATGHYARVGQNSELLAGLDLEKDQSYFLHQLTKDQLQKTLFPVGHLEKLAVRKLAQKYGLATADKKDSQGLCFIGKVNMKDFLREFIATVPGAVLDTGGTVIGEHDGALLYTIGERHGFRIGKKTPLDGRYFVVRRDLEKNTITVSEHPETTEAFRNRIVLENPSWTSRSMPDSSKTYGARIRYRGELSPCTLESKGEAIEVVFQTPQKNVSSGQSLVLYDGEICLGGGIIS